MSQVFPFEKTGVERDKSRISRKYDFDLEDYIPFQLVKTQLEMHRVVKPESVPGVVELAALSKGDSRILTLIALNYANSPTEISNAIGLDRAVITRHIASLTEKHLIEVEKDKQDQRRKTLCLTDAGEAVADKIIATMNDFRHHLDTLITPNEKKMLTKILSKLESGCENYPA